MTGGDVLSKADCFQAGTRYNDVLHAACEIHMKCWWPTHHEDSVYECSRRTIRTSGMTSPKALEAMLQVLPRLKPMAPIC